MESVFLLRIERTMFDQGDVLSQQGIDHVRDIRVVPIDGIIRMVLAIPVLLDHSLGAAYKLKKEILLEVVEVIGYPAEVQR